MDFTSRNSQPVPSAGRPGPMPERDATPTHVPGGRKNNNFGDNQSKLMRLGTICLLFSIVILAVAAILYLAVVNPGESRFVQPDDNQAVFLNSGQVYFGHIKDINDHYLTLQGIFYLQQTSTDNKGSAANVQLVKLGCELHAPYDQMVINRDQVTFWENLKPSGQVSTLISKYDANPPNGGQCTDQSQAPTSSNNNIQGQSSTSTQGSSSTSQSTAPTNPGTSSPQTSSGSSPKK